MDMTQGTNELPQKKGPDIRAVPDIGVLRWTDKSWSRHLEKEMSTSPERNPKDPALRTLIRAAQIVPSGLEQLDQTRSGDESSG